MFVNMLYVESHLTVYLSTEIARLSPSSECLYSEDFKDFGFRKFYFVTRKEEGGGGRMGGATLSVDTF